MKVLLIGAGAVGQVYGRHFQRGGAEVTFFVREKYLDEVRAGFDLYPLNESTRRKAPVRFEGAGAISSVEEVAAQTWDMVVVCISSTALRRGDWFAELVGVIGEATLVSLTPGPEDRDFVVSHVPAERVVLGLIGFSSYPGPLEGETLPKPGMVYWVPPLMKMAFSGPDARTRAVIAALNAGGLKSKQVKDTTIDTTFGGAVLQMHMVALELAGWTFLALRRDRELMKQAHLAMREIFTLSERRLDCRAPLPLRMVRPWILRIVLMLLPRIAPIDMEKFFEKHFTKVGDQTEDTMTTYSRLADELGTPHDALDAMRTRLVVSRQS